MKDSLANKFFLIGTLTFFIAGIIPAFLGDYHPVCRYLNSIGLICTLFLMVTEYRLPASDIPSKCLRIIVIIMTIGAAGWLVTDTSGSNFPMDIAGVGFILFGWRWYSINQKYAVAFAFLTLILTILCFVYTKQWANLTLVANYDKGLGHSVWHTYTYMLSYATFVVPVALYLDVIGKFDKYKYAIYISISLAIMICLFTQKRALLIDIALLLIYIFFYRVKKINFSYLLSIGVAVVISIYALKIIGIDVLSTLFNGIMDRFESTGEDMENFDRYVEFKKWSESVGPIEFVFGQGIGSFQDVIGFVNYHLHIGWFNLIFKGGLILSLTVFIKLSSNIIQTIKSSSVNKRAIIFINIFLLIHMAHSTMWGYSIDAMTIGMVLYSNKMLKI